MFPSEAEIKEACQVVTKEGWKIGPGLFNMCPLRAVVHCRGDDSETIAESLKVANHQQVFDFISAFDRHDYRGEVNTNSPEYKLGEKFREEYDKGTL